MTAARALLDHATSAAPDELEHAVAEALVREFVTEKSLRATIERAPLRAGIGALRSCLDAEGGPALTRSKFERQLTEQPLWVIAQLARALALAA